MASALQNSGVDVCVFSGTQGALQEELSQRGIAHRLVPGLVRAISPLHDLRAVLNLASELRQFRPQLISCHTAKAGLVGRLAGWLVGVPTIFTAHGWQFAEGISVWQKAIVLTLEFLLARISRKIITVSGYDQNLALHFRLGSRHKIYLVHNGMPNLLSSSPSLRGSSTVRLIVVARFQEQKDHATLFSALQTLEDLPWSLDLIGDGPERERWEQWVNDRQWSQRVTFAGQVLDVPRRLEASDIFVLPSLWEGFPRSILEAMRASLPVAATDVGGVSESVIDGKTGFLVPPKNPWALAKALGALMADGALRRQMGAAGRHRFEAEFTFDAMYEKTMSVWQKAGWVGPRRDQSATAWVGKTP